MMRKLQSVTAGLVAALMLVAVVSVAVRAEGKIETQVVNSGPQNWADLLQGRISFSEFWGRESSRKVDWSNHPCLPGERRVDTGDSGIACFPAQSASVTCEVLGYRDVNEGEQGVVRRAILGKCTSSWGGTGGWAGNGSAKPDTQSP